MQQKSLDVTTALLADAIRSEEIAKQLVASGETHTAQRFFEDCDWFLNTAVCRELEALQK